MTRERGAKSRGLVLFENVLLGIAGLGALWVTAALAWWFVTGLGW